MTFSFQGKEREQLCGQKDESKFWEINYVVIISYKNVHFH